MPWSEDPPLFRDLGDASIVSLLSRTGTPSYIRSIWRWCHTSGKGHATVFEVAQRRGGPKGSWDKPRFYVHRYRKVAHRYRLLDVQPIALDAMVAFMGVINEAAIAALSEPYEKQTPEDRRELRILQRQRDGLKRVEALGLSKPG